MLSDPKLITVYINEDMRLIIDRWSNNNKEKENYIFSIIDEGMSPLKQYTTVQLFVRLVNDWMDTIGKQLGIDKKITTYVARHSFSTIMKRSGASTEYIQEALGHANIKTTENYLDSFEKTVKKEFAAKLISFKKENSQN